ncbi:MAG: MarR family winged helix-turn-helix transcriptional regulator [Panacagrimonas sp.]
MKDRPDDPDFQFANLVRETYWLLRENVDRRLSPMGLSQAMWRPLLILHGTDGPMTQSQLARALGVESPTVVRLLDRLEARGWIRRCHCPNDRRAYHVELTEQALGLCVDLEAVVAEVRREALAGIDPADIEVAIAVLDRVRARIAGMGPTGEVQTGASDRPAG